MTNTTILTEDSATIIADEPRQFHWGAVIAGAVAATAVTFFLITLGSAVGLVLDLTKATTLLTAGAIYFFVSQAFGFTVGGYLVGRLIGPEVETDKEEEFRAAAHGFTMWAVAVVVGLLIAGFSLTGTMARPANAAPAGVSGYWLDVLFRPALNTPQVAADKAEAGRIWAVDSVRAGGINDADSTRIARLVGQDAELAMPDAMARVADVQEQMRQDAERARKVAGALAMWTAFALLFGAVVAVASAISARWLDDKVSFSMAPRRR